jgi:riboflavin kinase / FMN adenylyltransferase
MQVIEQIADARISQPSVVTVGSYDGIHVGHQHVLQQMKRSASRMGYSTVVVTFHPRPQAVLAPHRPTYDLTTAEDKVTLLDQLGVDVTVMLRFTRALAAVPAAEFVAGLVTHLQMRDLWLGVGSVLGRNREGDVPALRRLGLELGYAVHTVEPVICDGSMVSSTRIRNHLMEGQIRQVTRLLGRYPSLTGEVVHGARRGHQLGFPTANIAVPRHLALPPNGVYACFACVEDQRWPAVTNIGIRPTFSQVERTIEAHLLDFHGDLYGRQMRLELVDFQRPETRFDGLTALAAQITADALRARQLLSEETDRAHCSQPVLHVPGLRQACDPEPGSAGEP